ncbi:MAG: redox-sensing transcriptional repressor Rex [Phycisphaerales bacterium]
MSESTSDPSASPDADDANANAGEADRLPRRDRIPRPTVRRLSLYLRELEGSMDGNGTVSSRQLATALGLTDAQVRKDLAYFGQFGQPGIGYRHEELANALRRILGTDRPRATAVVGAGNLGRAVTCYGRLDGKGFNVVEVFDLDDAVVGTTVGGLVVRPMSELAIAVETSDIEIAMLAVPGDAADDVARQLVEAGVRGILNFAPVRLPVPDGVAVVSVDLTVALEQLAYKMALGIEGDEQHAAD